MTEDVDSPVTDVEKHAFVQRRGYPHAVFLPATLYAAAEKAGYDMRYYVINKPIPLGPVPDKMTRRGNPK